MNINKLKGLLAEKGVTHKDIAKLLGISVSAVQKKMIRLSNFSVEQLKAIADYLKVDINVFLN